MKCHSLQKDHDKTPTLTKYLYQYEDVTFATPINYLIKCPSVGGRYVLIVFGDNGCHAVLLKFVLSRCFAFLGSNGLVLGPGYM